MKTLLVRIGVFFLSLLIGVIGFIALVWFYPNILVTQKTIQWGLDQQNAIVFQDDFTQHLTLDIQNTDFYKQTIKVEALDFCIDDADGVFKACFDEFSLSVRITFQNFMPKVESVGPIVIQSPLIQIFPSEMNQSKSASVQKSDQFNIEQIINKYVSQSVTLKELHIDFASVEIEHEKGLITSSLLIKGENSNNQHHYQLDIDAQANLPMDPKVITVNSLLKIQKDFIFQGSLNARAYSQKQDPELLLKTQVEGSILDFEMSAKGNLAASNVAPVIDRIQCNNIEASINSQGWKVKSKFQISMMLGEMKNARASALPPLKLPSGLSGTVSFQKQKTLPLDFALHISPLQQYGISLSGDIEGQYDQKESVLHLDTFLVTLGAHSFENAVKALHQTQWAVPAPINQMGGSVLLKIGHSNMKYKKEKNFEIPVLFETELSSEQQSLKTKTEGIVHIEIEPFHVHVKLDTNLNDIGLRLPALDPIRPMPDLAQDDRLVFDHKKAKAVKQEESKTSFSLEVNVDTPGKPIQLFYNHFKPSAKFYLKAGVTEDQVDFSMQFEPFEIDYMKRTAKLKHFNVSMNPDTQMLLLDGRFLIKKAGYDLFADITKESEETYIVLSSNPPLPENDIISLILFNSLASELDGGSSDSVANTQYALTQKSIGFFSFFLLASTPVESVNYDPSTSKYSARIRLPGGFTATVGSDWDKAQEVGLRRRLGGNWLISATVGTDTDGQSRQQSMLEWFYRY